jgi:hypothetical protein
MQQLGKKVVFHTREDFPDLKKYVLQLLVFKKTEVQINRMRRMLLLKILEKQFYGLFPVIGNFYCRFRKYSCRKFIEDTYFVVKWLLASLIKKKSFTNC